MIRTRTLFQLALAAGVGMAGTASAQAPAQKGTAATKTVWPDEGPRTWAPRPTTSEITANDLRTRLYQISDDSMMGRRVGELGNYKTTEYSAREFKRLGLKPAGDNGTYFQDLTFGPLGFDRASSKLAAGGSALKTSAEWVPLAPAAASGVGGKADLVNVPTVFAGRWGDTTVALDPAVYKGKVAVFVASPGTLISAGGGRGAGAMLPRCDSVPDKFGAAAAIKAEADAAARGPAAARGGGRGAAESVARDARAQAAGAVAVLIVVGDRRSRPLP